MSTSASPLGEVARWSPAALRQFTYPQPPVNVSSVLLCGPGSAPRGKGGPRRGCRRVPYAVPSTDDRDGDGDDANDDLGPASDEEDDVPGA